MYRGDQATFPVSFVLRRVFRRILRMSQRTPGLTVVNFWARLGLSPDSFSSFSGERVEESREVNYPNYYPDPLSISQAGLGLFARSVELTIFQSCAGELAPFFQKFAAQLVRCFRAPWRRNRKSMDLFCSSTVFWVHF